MSVTFYIVLYVLRAQRRLEHDRTEWYLTTPLGGIVSFQSTRQGSRSDGY